jgi:hypothetical protein
MPDENHIERMRQALRVMREVVEQQKPFDFNVWIRHDDCGTAACASGYIQMDPWHQAQGLKTYYGGSRDHKNLAPYPIYKDFILYTALIHYFGFSRSEHFKITNIFHSSGYKSPRPSAIEVLKRMEENFNPYIEGASA